MDSRCVDEDRGDGVELEDEGGRRDGWGKEILNPCTPIVQSRYEEASSKSVSRETLEIG